MCRTRTSGWTVYVLVAVVSATSPPAPFARPALPRPFRQVTDTPGPVPQVLLRAFPAAHRRRAGRHPEASEVSGGAAPAAPRGRSPRPEDRRADGPVASRHRRAGRRG